jgi:hypothetical protein
MHYFGRPRKSAYFHRRFKPKGGAYYPAEHILPWPLLVLWRRAWAKTIASAAVAAKMYWQAITECWSVLKALTLPSPTLSMPAAMLLQKRNNKR